MAEGGSDKVILEIAQAVQTLWAEKDYDKNSFPAIAASALQESLDGQHFDLAEAVTSRVLMPKYPNAYIRPHGARGVLSFFTGPHFEVDAHIWRNDIATPHQHSWAGAFQILSGRSLNIYYQFTEEKAFDRVFAVGRTKIERIEYLEPGNCVCVPAGEKLIHSVCYGEDPGLAISIRSSRELGRAIDYRAAGLRFRPTKIMRVGTVAELDLQTILFGGLSAIHASAPEKFDHALNAVIERHCPLTVFQVLQSCRASTLPLGTVDLSTLEERFGGATAQKLWLSLEERQRVLHATSLRETTQNPDTRLFLGMLALVDNRTDAGRCAHAIAGEGATAWFGRCLVDLTIDDSEANVPDYLVGMFGRLAVGEKEDELIAEHAQSVSQSPERDAHFELFGQAAGLIKKELLYAPLFRN